jgi:hypothetical protein
MTDSVTERVALWMDAPKQCLQDYVSIATLVSEILSQHGLRISHELANLSRQMTAESTFIQNDPKVFEFRDIPDSVQLGNRQQAILLEFWASGEHQRIDAELELSRTNRNDPEFCICAPLSSEWQSKSVDASIEWLLFASALQTASDLGCGFPFRVDVATQVAECLRRLSSSCGFRYGDFTRLSTCYSASTSQAIRLGRWIELKSGKRESDFLLSVNGNVAFINELSDEDRLAEEWMIILNHPGEAMKSSTFYDAIAGKGKRRFDPVKTHVGRYRFRTDELPDGTKTQPLRNTVIAKYSNR